MLFSTPTANIASISGVTLLGISSSLAHETSGSIRAATATHTHTLGSECTYINAFKVDETADTGILDCSVGQVCIQDETSSMGGRWTLLQDTHADSRWLEGTACTFTNGTVGVKCQGRFACEYHENIDDVGCGSCIGDYACFIFGQPGTVGENSCTGRRSCYFLLPSGHVGDNSCNGEEACEFPYSNIGSCLCNGDNQCNTVPNTAQMDFDNCPTPPPSNTPTTTPTSTAPTSRPSTSPTSIPTSSPTTCATNARKVKIQSTTGEQIHLFDVKVFSISGMDETKNGLVTASQSSTLKNDARFVASSAVDSDFGSFSHTNDGDAWWQVDLGKEVEISSIDIINRWCGPFEVPNNCLCRLGGARLSLIDDDGSIVASRTITDDTCSMPSLSFDFNYSCDSCLPAANKVKLQSTTGEPLSLLEVEVYSSDVNIAAGKTALASSTFRGRDRFAAGNGIDESISSFLNTGADDVSPWWEVDLGETFDVSAIKIFSRLNKNDSTGLLCRLSQVSVLLLNAEGNWVDAVLTGDTCGKLVWEHEYESLPQYCFRN